MSANSENAIPFREWLDSKFNPLRNGNDAVRHFTTDALAAAFAAGMNYQLRKQQEYKKAEKDFSFD